VEHRVVLIVRCITKIHIVSGVFAVKVYGIATASAGDPERRNLEQKVMLANSVAQSFMSADNANSRGQRMFLVRRQKSEKWTHSGPDPQQWGGEDDGGAWPQGGAPVAPRHHYVAVQKQPRPLPLARQQSVPQHLIQSGPRPLARSTSVQGPTRPQQRHPGPHGLVRAQAAAPPPPPPYNRLGQYPRVPGPVPGGYLRPARAPGPVPGVGRASGMPVQQQAVRMRRSESFGSVPVPPAMSDVHPAPGQPRDRHFSGSQQQTMHQWSTSSPSPHPAYMQRAAAVPDHYAGVSDL